MDGLLAALPIEPGDLTPIVTDGHMALPAKAILIRNHEIARSQPRLGLIELFG
jgi:hypothetical protein